MKTLTGNTSMVKSEGHGPSVAVVVDQGSTDPGGWTLDLYAHTDDEDASEVFIKSIPVGAGGPGVQPTRLLCVATIPFARSFSVRWTAPSPAPNKPIKVGVFCSQMTAFPPQIVSA